MPPKNPELKKYNVVFVICSLLILILLGGSWFFLKFSFGELGKQLFNSPAPNGSPAGLLEKIQQGDLLITQVPTSQPELKDLPLLKPSDPALGSPQAKVTIVEFTDFLCPACAQLQPLLQQALETYPGQVRLIFKDAPNESMH